MMLVVLEVCKVTRFRQGNRAAYKHGGERAVVSIRRGLPLADEALTCQQEILDELGLDLDSLDDATRALVIMAAREGAAAELYWRAFCKAADAGDDEGMDRYVKRWGWLVSRFMRMLWKVQKLTAGQ